MQKGDLVKVIKGGLLSTGWVGTVQWAGGDKVEVKFPDRARPLTYNVASLEEQIKPKPKKAEVKRNRVVERVEVLDIPDDSPVSILYKDNKGKLQTTRTKFLGMDKNGNAAFRGITLKLENIVYIYREGRDKHTFLKPEVNEYPFWVFEDKVEKALRNFLVQNDVAYLQDFGGMLYLPKWMEDADKLRPIKIKEIERFEIDEDAEFDDLIGLLDKELHKAVVTAKDSNMSYGVAYIDSDGNPKLYTTFGAACHYSIKTFTGAIKDPTKCKWLCGVQFIGNRYHGRHANEEYKQMIKDWTMWVMNDSPWSQYIITKTFEEALESGVKVKLDIPSNALMCTFYALRYPTEYQTKVETWNGAVKAGVHPTMAFFYAETNKIHNNTRGHHQLLDTHVINKEYLIKFLKHEQGGYLTKPWTENFRYDFVSIHHGVPRDANVGETAVTWLKKQDIYSDEERNIGTAFNPMMVKDVDFVKLQKLTEQLKA